MSNPSGVSFAEMSKKIRLIVDFESVDMRYTLRIPLYLSDVEIVNKVQEALSDIRVIEGGAAE